MKLSKISFSQLILRSALALISVFMYSCASNPAIDLLSREGAKFNQDLSNTVKSSDRIVIVEHSHSGDFSDLNIDANKAPSYTYTRKILSAAERQYFAQQVDKLSNAKRKIYTLCAFVPHHTVYFYQNGKQTSSIKVCFKCGDVKWENGSKHVESRDLFNALSAVVKHVGLSPNADWKKKASDHHQTELEKKQEEEEQQATAKYPTAKAVPGKPGFLFNPYTQNQVNVEGIPSGTKVADPHDPQRRVFLVP